jgi:endonuclease/exonuclease/phosphatase (EEP) superfamily protein YafD
VVIRSWNIFHGNAWPPQRRSYLQEVIRLATEDRPDVLLLQEIPAWALGLLAGWSAMTATGDVAQRPRLGPVRISAGLGRILTAPHPGVLRSAFSGQANAILLRPDLQPLEHEVLTLNPSDFRRAVARRLGLPLRRRLAWAKERRICSTVRVENMLVANLHATSSPQDARLPRVELDHAVAFVESRGRSGEVLVLGGDFNLVGAHARLEGWSEPGPGIDHVLVRGASPSPLRVWPVERRRLGETVLSDHAPVELDL